MLLKNKYYRLNDIIYTDGLNAVYRVAILPDCSVYHGHFPGNPVCPGVCNIQTIKECAMLLTGKKLFIATIRQCRLTAVASPLTCLNVDITISASPTDLGFSITAKIADAERTYMEYKGEMIL